MDFDQERTTKLYQELAEAREKIASLTAYAEDFKNQLVGLRKHLDHARRRVSGRDKSGAWTNELMACIGCGRVVGEKHPPLCPIGIALTGIDNALKEYAAEGEIKS